MNLRTRVPCVRIALGFRGMGVNISALKWGIARRRGKVWKTGGTAMVRTAESRKGEEGLLTAVEIGR